MRYSLLLLTLVFVSCASIQDGRPTWLEERWGEVVPQTLDNSCSLASLVTVMHHHYGDYRYDEMGLLRQYIEIASEEELKEAMLNGLTLFELEVLARSIGYTTQRLLLSIEQLEKAVTFVPIVVYLEVGGARHFAVVRGMNGKEVWLADSSRGNVYLSHKEFLSEWQTPRSHRDRWERPGGFMLIRRESETQEGFLREPSNALPPSFRELRRQMIFK